MDSVEGNTELMKRPNAPVPIHNARENWCRYNIKEIAVKHPNCKGNNGCTWAFHTSKEKWLWLNIQTGPILTRQSALIKLLINFAIQFVFWYSGYQIVRIRLWGPNFSRVELGLWWWQCIGVGSVFHIRKAKHNSYHMGSCRRMVYNGGKRTRICDGLLGPLWQENGTTWLTRFTKSILSGTRNTETKMEINLPTANEHCK